MRAIHVIAVAFIAAVLFVACGGGQSSGINANRQVEPGQDQLRTALNLELSSEALDNGSYRVYLYGRQARDLYQIAGSLLFDTGLYTVELVEAGGGLGGPDESYFVDGQSEAGRLDFAYTRRWFGDGISGDPLLLSVTFRPLGSFSEKDFSIDSSPGAIRVRDSHKQDLQFSCEGREAGNE